MDRLIRLSKNVEMFSALRHRNYQLLWQGTIATQVGQWMQQVALGWLVLDLTNSPLQIGLVAFARAVPMIVFGLFGGVLADRLDRRKSLMGTQSAIMLIAAVIATLVATGLVQIWHLYLLSFLHGTVMSLNQPVRQSLISDLVPREDMPNAVALFAAANNLTRIVAPAFAGVLIGVVGTASCFLIQALGFMLALWTTSKMSLPPKDPSTARTNVWHDLIEGLDYIRHSVPIFLLMALAAVTTAFGMPYQQLMPVFARDVLDVGASGLGLLMSATGLGAFVGALFVVAAGHRTSKPKVVIGCSLGMGSLLIAFSSSHWFGLSIALLFLVGAATAALNANLNTLVQSIAPSHLRGRILSAYILTWALLPLGTLPSGAVADVLGAPLAVTVGGAVVVVFTLGVALLAPQFRRIG